MKKWIKNELHQGSPPMVVARIDKIQGSRGRYTVYIPLPYSPDGYSNKYFDNLSLKKAKKAAEQLVEQWFDRFKVL